MKLQNIKVQIFIRVMSKEGEGEEKFPRISRCRYIGTGLGQSRILVDRPSWCKLKPTKNFSIFSIRLVLIGLFCTPHS